MNKQYKEMSHKELDKEWEKLSKKYKVGALEWVRDTKALLARWEESWKEKKEAEKGKKVGEECTCIPRLKNSYYIEDKCSYCQWQASEDYYNSPG